MMAALKKIGTHDGIFHCDEVLACYMLKKLPEFTTAQIIRSRDQSVLNTCDIVVDVGGEYDPARHRYDHHQRSFSSTMNSLSLTSPSTIKLSSAGLVYHHFGRRVLEAVTGKSDEDLITSLHHYVYQNFIQEIDGIDNGVPMFDGEPKYRIHTNLSSRVGHLNPAWNTKEEHNEMKLFCKAMDLVGVEFEDRVSYFVEAWWPARKIVKEAFDNRFKVHESGEILELSTCCPWKEHLVAIEKEEELGGVIKFVLFTDTKSNWRVQGVPVDPNSFVLRVPLNEKWMGLRDKELSTVCGIDDCIFVHSSGFIGGNKTKAGALEMAVRSLELQQLQHSNGKSS